MNFHERNDPRRTQTHKWNEFPSDSFSNICHLTVDAFDKILPLCTRWLYLLPDSENCKAQSSPFWIQFDKFVTHTSSPGTLLVFTCQPLQRSQLRGASDLLQSFSHKLWLQCNTFELRQEMCSVPAAENQLVTSLLVTTCSQTPVQIVAVSTPKVIASTTKIGQDMPELLLLITARVNKQILTSALCMRLFISTVLHIRHRDFAPESNLVCQNEAYE